jgi:DNA-binding NtrC family response regulator
MTASLRLVGGERTETPSFHGMIGAHPAMLRLYDEIRRAAPLDLPIVVEGPTGSGKELVARALHALSGRRGALVPVNVGTIPEQLAESELFGSVRGAYTGAVASRAGLIEAALHGILFLDEAGDLSHSTQVRLLRALESGEIRPVGGSATRRIEFGLVLSVQRPVREMIAARRWREDFYYRVAGIVLRVPPLDERRSDIRLLVNHWLVQLGRPTISDSDAGELASRAWPGNVRELRRAVERAVFLAATNHLGASQILEAAECLDPRAIESHGLPTTPPLSAVDRDHIEAVLRETSFNTKAAAELLGLSIGQLYRRFRALGITPPRQR